MRFHVICKCIKQQDGDIVIDLEDMAIKKVDFNEELDEDRTYVEANGQLIIIHNLNWSIKDSYLEAFDKTRKLKKQDFKFLRIKNAFKIYIDKNNFIFSDNKLIGRLVNEGEIHNLENMGLGSFNELLTKLAQEEIVFLVRGKKVYRIFTHVKLRALLKEDSTQISMYQYLHKNESNEILEKLRENIRAAYKRLDTAIKHIDEELGN